MNKNMLSKEVAVSEKITLTTAFKAVRGTLRVIAETLAKGESVVIKDFGTFSVVDKAERSIRDIHTGQPITIPAHKTVVFRPAKSIVEPINSPAAGSKAE